MIRHTNLFGGIDSECVSEQVTEILAFAAVRIERIVSHGEASPPGFLYDQGAAEWVLDLSGAVGILFEGETRELILRKGTAGMDQPRHRAPNLGYPLR